MPVEVVFVLGRWDQADLAVQSSVVESVDVLDDLEIAVAEYIDWFNQGRLHGEIGLVPPAEHEDVFYRHNPAATTVAASVPSGPPLVSWSPIVGSSCHLTP